MTTTETMSTPFTSAAKTSGKPWWLIGAGVMLVVLAVAGYFALHWWLGRNEVTGNIKRHTVERRSFPIILEEKGELLAANSIKIRSELEGRATIIQLVEEGAHVKKGDLLVELASDEIEERIRDAEIREATAKAAQEAAIKEHEILLSENASKIRKAELALEMAKLDLKRYQEGEQVEKLQDAQLALDRAKNVLKRDREYYQDSIELHEQGFITKIELENDQFKAYEAEIALKKAEKALEVLEKYTFPMELREKQSALDEAAKELDREQKAAAAAQSKSEADVAAKKAEFELISSKLKKYREQKSKARILAPADGLVVFAKEGWHRRDNAIEEGMQVYERQDMIELPDTSQMKVVVRVHEAQTEYLKLGAKATVEVEGLTGQVFTGKVSKIAVVADSQNRWLNPNLKEHETEILLDSTTSNLKPGATAHVRINLAQVTDDVAIPVQAVFSSGGNYYVFTGTQEEPEPREVTVGLSSNEFVQITSGLAAGEEVWLTITDEQKLLLPNGDEQRDEDEDNADDLATVSATG